MVITRREWMQVGYSRLLGLALPGLMEGVARAEGPARARSVIVIFLSGGLSHIDTFDMKPEAPTGIRGEFRPVETRVPGVRICEHLPLLAACAGRFALVRTLSHRNPTHRVACHHVQTGSGRPGKPDDDQQDENASRDDWPCYAAGLQYLRPRGDGLPTGISLPTYLNTGPETWPGQDAGFLGPRHDPWFIESDPNAPDFRVESLSLPAGLGLGRVRDRRRLLDRVTRERRRLDSSREDAFDGIQGRAFHLLDSTRVARAFDLGHEPPAVRDRYGRTTYGQSLLLARRLVEAEVPVIQANLGKAQAWDMHGRIFDALRGAGFLPSLDRAVSALLADLDARGLLDETLVLMIGEFGRSPKVGLSAGSTTPGRDHWPTVFSALFAGAGVRGGQVIGQSDKNGAYPTTAPYSPADVAATVYRSLGVEEGAEVRDRLGRPIRLNRGDVIRALYSA